MNTRSLVGKIAALPHDIREQLNCRLRDGQTAPLILPWLNAFPAVQKILADRFAGAPVNSQNLCNWRASGYQRWLEMQSTAAPTPAHSRSLRRFAHAARGMASGAAALATDQLFQSLCSGSGDKISPDDLLKILPPIATLFKADQNHLRLKLAKRRARQKDAQLQLTRIHHLRETAAMVLRTVHDQCVHLIEAATIGDEEKIQLIGRHLYGKAWESGLTSSPGSLSSENLNSQP